MSNKIEEMSFEAALARLEVIVRMLESGNAALDESLDVFEEGIALVKMCNDKLEGAQQRIKLLTDNGDGSLSETDFKPTELKG